MNVRSGNFVYFDTATHTIGPEHVIASGSLPPGFPAVEIDGELYWDGGLVSNTPLEWVLESEPRKDTLAFQVDLWNAVGNFPGNLAEVETRRKEIQYSSRTRANTDHFKHVERLRNTVAGLLDDLPDDMKNHPAVEVFRPVAERKAYNIVHLIYRARNYEGHSKDYEFSRPSMQTHWRTGYHDTIRTLRHPRILERPPITKVSPSLISNTTAASRSPAFGLNLRNDRCTKETSGTALLRCRLRRRHFRRVPIALSIANI